MNLNHKKPNLFILGAAKAGTTSLHEILRQHPQIYFPFDKEPAFFCDDNYFSKGNEWYLKTFFSKVKEQPVRGEATSRYLYFGEKVAPRIQRFCEPDQPKFIVIFRDPAKLVYSFYWNSVREGKEDLPFPDALAAEGDRMLKFQQRLEQTGQILFAYSKVAAYARQLTSYLTVFPKDHFLCLLTDDLSDFPSLISRLEDFLELKDQSGTIKPVIKNAASLPKNSAIHQWLRNRSKLKDVAKLFIPLNIRYKMKEFALGANLKEFAPPDMDPEIANSIRAQYSDETRRLQDLIHRDLTGWLPQ